MKVSLSAIKWQGYTDLFDISVDELVRKIGAQLGEVKEVTNLGAHYDHVVVARVISCVDHPDADRLHICMIDDGGSASDVERDENGHVQVVCGAPNVREGLLVAWLPPGSTVPSSVSKDPFVLGSRELRGKVSNGMLASPSELAISDNHDGILEIDPGIEVWTHEGTKNPWPGMDFKELYGLDDTIIDIENKMFTHRPDCFGLLGVARELAGIQQKSFKSPAWYLNEAALPAGEGLPLRVRNELPEIAPRFLAVTMKNVAIAPSPIWLQSFLSRLGVKSINNVVDVTNYIMLLTGQPLHAYDYDKVKALDGGDAATLVVRHPKVGERIKLLNGKEIAPRSEAIMIATKRQLIGVGGVMGGSDTEVDTNTKNIILECASFDMYSIRRTSMTHGLFTDAVTRFNKGQSAMQNDRVAAQAIGMITELSGAQVAGDVIDEIGTFTLKSVTVTASFINERLGLTLPADQMRDLLQNVEFTVSLDSDTLTITPPFWRTDIDIPEDIVEEVGRLYGYDHLPLVLPLRSITPAARNKLVELKTVLRKHLAAAGANEVQTYSFAHGKLLEKAEQSLDDAFGLSNALSPDLQYYRLSLLPSLLDKVHPNIKAGYEHFMLYEIGKGHNTKHFDKDGMPVEFEMLEAVVAASPKAAPKGNAYFEAKYQVTQILESLGITADFETIPEDIDYPIIKPFDQRRTALIKERTTGQLLGAVGEIKASVRKAFKLPAYTASFGLSLSDVLQVRNQQSVYVPLPKFPKAEQDICLRVPVAVSHRALEQLVESALRNLRDPLTHATLAVVDIYQRENDINHKQVTFRISIAHFEKTMTDTEVTALLDGISAAAASAFAAERV
jgi:phenylalanyl-tRNA synthetase beta chain